MSRQLSVTIVAAGYLIVGIVGFAAHFNSLLARDALSEGVPIEATEVVAVIAGVFLLRAQNWARWLALAWIAFHVALLSFSGRVSPTSTGLTTGRSC